MTARGGDRKWLRFLGGGDAPIDSTFVSRRIKTLVQPKLREQGFSQFTSRTAHRHRSGTIDVVTFRSWNAYHASVLGCTTFSFSIDLGCWMHAIPSPWGEAKSRRGRLAPSAPACPFRITLRRGIRQRECAEDYVWYVDPKARNLDVVLADAWDRLAESGLPALDRLQDPHEALRILENEEEDLDGGLWGFGRPGSPLRSYFIGYLALSTGDRRRAEQVFREVLSGDSFTELHPAIESAMRRAVE